MKMVVHCKKDKYDVYVGRPSSYGNPFVIGKDGTRADVIRLYREWVLSQPELVELIKRELKGKVLACWCFPLDCHAVVLVEISNED